MVNARGRAEGGVGQLKNTLAIYYYVYADFFVQLLYCLINCFIFIEHKVFIELALLQRGDIL